MSILLFPTCKRVIDVELRSVILKSEKLFKKLQARLNFVVVVFEYVLVWMWSEDLWPDSFVTVIADWFLRGCASREGAISGLCYSEVSLALEVVDRTAALLVTQSVFQFPPQTCNEVKNLCWSDFLGDYPGSPELLWCHAGKRRDGCAGIKNAIIFADTPTPLHLTFWYIYTLSGKWKVFSDLVF